MKKTKCSFYLLFLILAGCVSKPIQYEVGKPVFRKDIGILGASDSLGTSVCTDRMSFLEMMEEIIERRNPYTIEIKAKQE